MSYDTDEHYENAIDYLKKNFDYEKYRYNEEIIQLYKFEHHRDFTIKCRRFIEYLNKKYINMYQYSGMFQHDLNNVTWERVFDIVYDNIHCDMDINFIYNNANDIIDILENNI